MVEVSNNLQISGDVSLDELVAIKSVTELSTTEHQKGENNSQHTVNQTLSGYFQGRFSVLHN